MASFSLNGAGRRNWGGFDDVVGGWIAIDLGGGVFGTLTRFWLVAGGWGENALDAVARLQASLEFGL